MTRANYEHMRRWQRLLRPQDPSEPIAEAHLAN